MVWGKVDELGVVSLGKNDKSGSVAKYTPIEPHTNSRVASPVLSSVPGVDRREEPTFKVMVPVIDKENPLRLQNGGRKTSMGMPISDPFIGFCPRALQISNLLHQ